MKRGTAVVIDNVARESVENSRAFKASQGNANAASDPSLMTAARRRNSAVGLPFEFDEHLLAWQGETAALGGAHAMQWRVAFRDIGLTGLTAYQQQLRWLLMHKRAPCGEFEYHYDRLVQKTCRGVSTRRH